MKRNIKIIGMSGAIFLSALGTSALDHPNEEGFTRPSENVQQASMQESNQRYEDGFQWILHNRGNDKILGRTPDFEDEPKSLEERVFTDKDPSQIDLNEWELTALSRLVPLKKTIEREANRYMINPMWALMFYNFESQLNPSDYNFLSNDFGLGQIKRDSEILAKEIGTDPTSPFFSPHLEKSKSIFDPETNIIMSLILHRYNIEKYGLTDSDQTYAVYVRGEPGLNRDGTLSYLTEDILEGFRERFYVYQDIIPLFRIPAQDVKGINNEDTRFLLGLYHQDKDIEDMYRLELDHFLEQIEAKVEPDTKAVLMLDDCVAYSQTLDLSFGINQDDNYQRLKRLEDRFMKKTKGDLKRRVEMSYERLDRDIDR